MLLGLMSLPPDGLMLAEKGLARWRDDFFGTFSDRPSRFRAQLRSCAGIIAGSAVIRAAGQRLGSAQPSIGWDSATDVFIPQCFYETFCTFVLKELGGTSMECTTYPHGSTAYYISERRVIHTRRAVLCIHCTVDACPLVAVAASRLDIQLSFISADVLCIAYPWALAYKKAAVRPVGASQTDPTAKMYTQKYERRGYAFEVPWIVETNACKPHGMCPKATRFFGDEHCLTVVCPDASSSHSLMPASGDKLHITALWTFGGPPCGNQSCSLHVDPAIQYSTICAPIPLY